MNNKKKKNTKETIGTILIVLIILVGIAAVIYVNQLSKKNTIPDDTIGNTSGNLNNRGLLCESDGYIYFSNPYDRKALYRMKEDGTEIKCLVHVPVEYINVYDDTVYFYQLPGADEQVFGLSGLFGICYTDTKGKDGLNNIDKTLCNSLVLYGKNLYYQHYDKAEGLTLYRADAKTEAKEKISDKRVFVSTPYDGKFMCYNEDNSYFISLFNPQTNQMELFDQDIRAYNIIVEGEYMYYMNIDDSYRIYRMKLSDHTTEKLTDDRVDLFNIQNGNIFYQKNSEQSPALMRMNADGSNVSVIASGNYTSINCSSNYAYFYSFGEEAPIYRVPLSGGSVETLDIPTQ